MQEIKTFDFNKHLKEQLDKEEKGTNWPVVYLLNNDKQIYIGESSNVKKRMENHLNNPERKKLKKAHIIFDDTYNKSSILDIESLLIQHISAEGSYTLQNRNNGQSREHNYYQREKYINSFDSLWNKLLEKDIVSKKLDLIKNSDLFKFSPYKVLTEEQYDITTELLSTINNNINDNLQHTFIINGGAGTGKSVLAVYLMKQLIDINTANYNDNDLDDDEIKYTNIKNKKELKIGLVIAMSSLRTTLQNVFKQIPGLKKNLVISPNDVAKEKYDILIVDEAHRLMKRKNLTNYNSYDKANKKLNLNKEATQLDWIMKQATFPILLYDNTQSIKPTDVNESDFLNIINKKSNLSLFNLTSQLRVKGGNDYINYINAIFSDNPPKNKITFNTDFELKLFDNVDDMINQIKQKDKQYGLCRNVAGFAWEWKTKGKNLQEIIDNHLYDINIDNYKYIWNSTNIDWVNSKNAINEIGCIHTIQGYDLNYVGVIIGKDLIYRNNQLMIDKNSYKDKKGKASITDEKQLKNYILNIYKVLLKRGINGVYIYAVDDKLQKYLKKYI